MMKLKKRLWIATGIVLPLLTVVLVAFKPKEQAKAKGQQSVQQSVQGKAQDKWLPKVQNNAYEKEVAKEGGKKMSRKMSKVANAGTANYRTNQYPLRANPYLQLPLGSIQPEGWLKEQLVRMKRGMTGHLDELYPQVMGSRNGWLGGDGDVWERGPYWIDGLLPLAYLLNDQGLKDKVQKWVEWSIKTQDSSGYFGPRPTKVPVPNEPGLQRNKPQDWWPKMVMLKVLKQYYDATNDQRVINLMTRYFHYQLRELPRHPLDNWSWWGAQRGGDNLLVVYWLYNITRDKSLLELAEIIHQQTTDWTSMLTKGKIFDGYFKLHGVNLAMGIKEPLIYYQQHPEQRYYQAVLKGFRDIRQKEGQPHGFIWR